MSSNFDSIATSAEGGKSSPLMGVKKSLSGSVKFSLTSKLKNSSGKHYYLKLNWIDDLDDHS